MSTETAVPLWSSPHVLPAPSEIISALSYRATKRLSPLANRFGLDEGIAVGSPTLSVLSREGCLCLLASVPVGRVGLSINALPVVLPVNFALFDGDIVFRTVDGTKFHAAAAGAVLAFEADGFETCGTSGWSVLVQGVSRVVTDPSELCQARQLTVKPWALDQTADRIVRVTASLVSGRRFRRTPV